MRRGKTWLRIILPLSGAVPSYAYAPPVYGNFDFAYGWGHGWCRGWLA
jgi:hypothetical protein